MNHTLAVCEGRSQAVSEKRPVDNFRPAGEQPQRDLRRRTVMRHAEKLALGIQHANGVARRGIAAVHNIARKNPGMAAGGTIGRFAVYTYGSQVPSVKPRVKAKV